MRDSLVRQGVDRFGAAVALLDADGTVVYANDSWKTADVAGTVPAATAVGDDALSTCEAIADGAAVGSIESLLAGEQEQARLEYNLPRADPLPRRFRLQGHHVSAENGAHVVIKHTERTDEYRTAQERDHCQSALADVATVVSHDIRSPLTAALSWAELLEVDPDTDSEKVGRVRSGITRANAIADAAVTLARKTAVEKLEPVDIEGVAARAWDRIDSTAADLVVEDIEPVLADEQTVEVIMKQLLGNAVQHGRPDEKAEDATLTVSVGPLTNGFYIADDGTGVEEGVRDNLFDAGVTTGSATDNTGIGLATVERAVEAHRWTVELAGQASGGARFEITGVVRPS